MQEKDGISYFWDTYAIIELENGNPKYEKYSDEPVILTIFNLAEIYWVFLNQFGESEAEEVYETYKSSIVEIDDETLKKAIKLRKKHYKNKKLSYTDAIGYTYALKYNMKFFLKWEDFFH